MKCHVLHVCRGCQVRLHRGHLYYSAAGPLRRRPLPVGGCLGMTEGCQPHIASITTEKGKYLSPSLILLFFLLLKIHQGHFANWWMYIFKYFYCPVNCVDLFCVQAQPAVFAQTWSVKILFCLHTDWRECKSVPTTSQQATTPAFLTKTTRPSGSITAWRWWPSTPSEMLLRTPWRSTWWKSVLLLSLSLFGSTCRSKLLHI